MTAMKSQILPPFGINDIAMEGLVSTGCSKVEGGTLILSFFLSVESERTLEFYVAERGWLEHRPNGYEVGCQYTREYNPFLHFNPEKNIRAQKEIICICEGRHRCNNDYSVVIKCCCV